MPLYSQEIINEVIQATDLLELVSHYVALKRTGANYLGLCPFHNEKTPSFTVSPGRGLFYCFGCRAGGGAVQFLMRVENLGFPEALEELARRAGVELPAAAAAPDEVHRAAIYEALAQAQKFYADRLWSAEGAAARRYLSARGLGRASALAFGLGFAPSGWDALRRHLETRGFGEQAAERAGLVRPGKGGGRGYDFFRSRLMVPITDAQGRVTAFGGRLLPGSPEEGVSGKYINTGATPVYTKGNHLFGLRRARPFIRAAGLTYLVEGYFDLISLAEAGVNEVTASLGTAVTDRQIKLLKGLTERVFLLFDGDAAGLDASLKNLPAFLNADLSARVVRLPEGHDPDSFIRERGAEALAELGASAPDIFDFWVDHLKSAAPEAEGVNAQFRRLAASRELLAQLPDPAKKQIVRRRLAALLNIDEVALAGPRDAPEPPRALRLLRRTASGAETTGAAMDETALALLKFILTHPETAERVLDGMSGYWPDDDSRLLFDRLKKVAEAEGSVSAASARCDDLPGPLAALAAQAGLQPRSLPPDQTEAAAMSYMKRLADKWRRKRQSGLSAAIARAQAAGDEPEIRRLQAEKEALSRGSEADPGGQKIT